MSTAREGAAKIRLPAIEYVSRMYRNANASADLWRKFAQTIENDRAGTKYVRVEFDSRY